MENKYKRALEILATNMEKEGGFCCPFGLKDACECYCDSEECNEKIVELSIKKAELEEYFENNYPDYSFGFRTNYYCYNKDGIKLYFDRLQIRKGDVASTTYIESGHFDFGLIDEFIKEFENKEGKTIAIENKFTKPSAE